MLTNQFHKNNKKHTQNAVDFMPTDERSIHVLQERANQLAQTIQTSKQEEFISYIRFRVGINGYYGIPFLSAKEVMQNITITQLPNTPGLIAGIMNWRGILLVIIDLNNLLHNQSMENKNNNSIIAVISNHLTVGILAEHIEGSDYYNPVSLEAPLVLSNVTKSDYILGLHNGNTAILNIENIVSDIQSQLNK